MERNNLLEAINIRETIKSIEEMFYTKIDLFDLDHLYGAYAMLEYYDDEYIKYTGKSEYQDEIDILLMWIEHVEENNLMFRITLAEAGQSIDDIVNSNDEFELTEEDMEELRLDSLNAGLEAI